MKGTVTVTQSAKETSNADNDLGKVHSIKFPDALAMERRALTTVTNYDGHTVLFVRNLLKFIF